MSSSGAKRERIVIQVNTPSQDAEGQPVASWGTHATVWAQSRFLSGRELAGMNKPVSEQMVEFETNYRTDITQLMRVSWRSETWNIEAIQPAESKFVMKLITRKVE